jgi:hypothetical protein
MNAIFLTRFYDSHSDKRLVLFTLAFVLVSGVVAEAQQPTKVARVGFRQNTGFRRSTPFWRSREIKV